MPLLTSQKAQTATGNPASLRAAKNPNLGWQLCSGTAGNLPAEWVAAFVWNQWQLCSGIRKHHHRKRAVANGRSAEAEHRMILEAALRGTKRLSLAEALMKIPTGGNDSDFARQDENGSTDVFD